MAVGGGPTPLISARRTRVPATPPTGTGTGGPGAPRASAWRCYRGPVHRANTVRRWRARRVSAGVPPHGRAYARTVHTYVRARASIRRLIAEGFCNFRSRSMRMDTSAATATGPPRDGRVGRASHRAGYGTVRVRRPRVLELVADPTTILYPTVVLNLRGRRPSRFHRTHEAVQTYSPWSDGGGPSGGRPGSGSTVSCREGAPSVPWPSGHVRNICRSSEHSSGVSA